MYGNFFLNNRSDSTFRRKRWESKFPTASVLLFVGILGGLFLLTLPNNRVEKKSGKESKLQGPDDDATSINETSRGQRFACNGIELDLLRLRVLSFRGFRTSLCVGSREKFCRTQRVDVLSVAALPFPPSLCAGTAWY